MKDKRKLHFTSSDEQNFRTYCDELGRLCKQCLDKLKPLLPSFVTEYIEALQFDQLIDSTIERSTDAAILCDDIQRFERFSMAVSLITKSSSDVTQEYSRQLESCLHTIATSSKKLLLENGASPPQVQDLAGLKERLDDLTRSFLDFVKQNDKENTNHEKELQQSVVDDVRNYVTVRDLCEIQLYFLRDLGHLMG